MIPVLDMHCDALSKLLEHPDLEFGKEQSGLDVCLPYLLKSDIRVQAFAIYLSDRTSEPSFDRVVQSVSLLHRKILRGRNMILVKTADDLRHCIERRRHGALLTLEGADALAGNLSYLPILFELGVRCIGITWNYGNWAADGVLESRRAGFTAKGKQLVKECEQLGILIDVSHLNEPGFWELAEMARKPFFASHSNAYRVCPHPRNLQDEQIRAIIRHDGAIGLTFVPYFVQREKPATIDDLLRHIEHICSLGGVGHIGFGSDFDGIEEWIRGLEHAGQYVHLTEALLKRYKEEEVKGFLYRNMFVFLERNLPNGNERAVVHLEND